MAVAESEETGMGCAWYYMRTRVCEFEMYLQLTVVVCSMYFVRRNASRYIVPGTYLVFVLAVAPDADHLTRTVTAVTCAWMLWLVKVLG